MRKNRFIAGYARTDEDFAITPYISLVHFWSDNLRMAGLSFNWGIWGFFVAFAFRLPKNMPLFSDWTAAPARSQNDSRLYLLLGSDVCRDYAYGGRDNAVRSIREGASFDLVHLKNDGTEESLRHAIIAVAGWNDYSILTKADYTYIYSRTLGMQNVQMTAKSSLP